MRARLDAALAELEQARIGTIHGFCADLLRERAVEARVDPQFEVAAEDEKERLYGECFERWFQGVLADPPEGVRRILRRRSRDRDALGPRLILKRAGGDLIEQRDFAAPGGGNPSSASISSTRLFCVSRRSAIMCSRPTPKTTTWCKTSPT